MNAGRTRSSWLAGWVALFIAFALLSAAAGLALGLAQHSHDGVDGTGWFARELEGATTQAARSIALAQAEQELDLRARSIASGDTSALGGVPFTRFRLSVPGTFGPSLADLVAGEFRTNVTTQYRLRVDPVRVERTAGASFELGASGWRLVDLDTSERDLWSYGPVSSASNGKSLVLGSEAFNGRLESLAAQAESARADVVSFWTQQWPGRIVVVLPAKTRWMDGLIGDSGASKFPAVATRDSGKGGPVNRITVNPTVFSDLPYLGQQIILRHEITHVAQNSLRQQGRVPLWLSEGLATYVGYRGSGVPDEIIGRFVFGLVRTTGAPDQFARDEEFDFDSSRHKQGLAYEKGWSVCAMIADQFGESKLVPFYVSVARGKGDADERIDSASRHVLGVSGQSLVARWNSWLQANA